MELPYICKGYISASRSGSGLLYPIYRLGSLNFDFVQEIGKNGEITSFIPFYDIESFRVFFPMYERNCGISSFGLYAYIDQDGSLVECDHLDLSKLARTDSNFIENEKIPVLTRLAIARLGRAPETVQARLFKSFLASGPASKRSTKILLDAQNRQFSTEKFWWDNQEEFFEDDDDKIDSVSLQDVEDVFLWLFSEGYSRRWANQLSRLMKVIVFDQRYFDLLATLASHKAETSEEFTRREKFMIGRGIEFYSGKDGGEEDFADTMYDFITNGEIFSLVPVVSIRSILSFITKLDEAGKLDGIAIDIYLDELRSEYISSDVATALIFRVLESRHLRQRYPEGTPREDQTRLHTLKQIVSGSGRIGLVVDRSVRQHVMRQ